MASCKSPTHAEECFTFARFGTVTRRRSLQAHGGCCTSRTLARHATRSVETSSLVITQRVAGMYSLSKRSVADFPVCPNYGGDRIQRELFAIGRNENTRRSDPVLKRVAYLASHLGNLANAYRHICRHGGPASGCNGLSFLDLGYQEAAEFLQVTRQILRDEKYVAGPLREIQIPKVGRAGFRTISLLNLEDRVIQRALAQIGNALIDPQFSEASFGYRPKIGRVHAAAFAVNRGIDRCEFVVCQDLKDAFDHANPERALQILTKRLPCEEFITLARRSLTSSGKLGLRQGSPLSPLIINSFLDHSLDRPWQKMHPEWPILRYADDILVLTNSLDEAVEADQKICELLDPTGMIPKWDAEKSIVRIEEHTELTWLGYGIRRVNGHATFTIAQKYWDGLIETIEEMGAHDHPIKDISGLVKGWVSELGPCFEGENRDHTFERVQQVCHDHQVECSVDRNAFEQCWQRSHQTFKDLTSPRE